jgi:hypothetical protein
MLCHHEGVEVGDLISDINAAKSGAELAKIFINFLHHRNTSASTIFFRKKQFMLIYKLCKKTSYKKTSGSWF